MKPFAASATQATAGETRHTEASVRDFNDAARSTARPPTPAATRTYRADNGGANRHEALIDPFELYLQREDGAAVFFEGDYVFFNGQSGKWTRGPDKEPIGATVPFLCNMHEISVGWIKFVDGKIADRQIGRIIDGYVRPPRETLGDLEQRHWPLNRRGEREDPWKKVTYLPMRCMADDEPVVYGPFSDTARRAIKSSSPSTAAATAPGSFPSCCWKTAAFQTHGGTTYVPEFKIVGWEYWDGQPAPEPQPVPLPPPAPAKAGDQGAAEARRDRRHG